MATFYSWQVSQLRHDASGTVMAGRLQAGATIAIEEVGILNPQSATGKAPFELFGPGDVRGLATGVITRRFPGPGVCDAEQTKRALVEFSRPDTLDLPWRYSLEAETPEQIRPWIVLVVGVPGDVTLTGDGRVSLSPQTQIDHDLSKSHVWAHVHDVDGVKYSRVLSPMPLEAGTQYIACLVPAYIVEPDGAFRAAWPAANGQTVRIACYDSWSFRTGEKGDFRDLAKLIQTPQTGELDESFGRAKVRYSLRGVGDPQHEVLDTAGALQRPTMVGVTSTPPPGWVSEEVRSQTDQLPTPDGRWVLTSPLYHKPFTPPATQPVAGWSKELTIDPRQRGAAGLGAWAGIAWQDRIADAASVKAGDLAIARDRIGHLALGLEATRSLWYRRLPPDPMDKLSVLGSMLGRMPVSGNDTVTTALSGRTPRMTSAIWSSAARRALRPGPARSSLTKDHVLHFRDLLAAATDCPERPADPEAIWGRISAEGADPDREMYQVLLDAFRQDERKAEVVLGQLVQSGGISNLNTLAAVLAALAPGEDGEVNIDKVVNAIWEPPQIVDEGEIGQLIDELESTPDPDPCNAIDTVVLGKAISNAVNPFAERPIVMERVLCTLPGFKDIGPVEIEPELDLPLWHFLKVAAPDWLLPGIGDLQPHRIVALATNPAFVECLLVGANNQAIGELRWRNMPIAARWSPLRKFWQRAGGKLDILPIRTWPAGSEFGGPGLAPPEIGAEAVVLFRTPLFRRYPATVVYLYKAAPDWAPPGNGVALVEADKQYPVFVGNIGPEITFFGFPIPPNALSSQWVVLEEPPTGYRFYSRKDEVPMPTTEQSTGAGYACGTFAPPVRVMIGKLALI